MYWSFECIGMSAHVNDNIKEEINENSGSQAVLCVQPEVSDSSGKQDTVDVCISQVLVIKVGWN